jgi:hypothetical protein
MGSGFGVPGIVPSHGSMTRHPLSGRALARAPVGGGFPVSPFRLRGGFTLPPWTTFPAALPGIPYVGLSPVRLQAPGTVKFSMEPSRPGVWVKSDPDIRHTPRRFAPAFGIASIQRPLRLGVRYLDHPRLHLGPEVLAQAEFCCPRRHRFATSSASLNTFGSFPSYAGYRDDLWHSRILLPGLQTFRAFAAELSRIAAFSFRRETRHVLPSCFHAGTGHRIEGRNPWRLQPSRHQLHAGTPFRRLVRSLSLRPF